MLQRKMILTDKEDGYGWIGPKREKGPLPAVFYFALSAEESLCQDPYNQPALALVEKFSLRVFSITLPFHGDNYSPLDAMTHWAQENTADPTFFPKFFHLCSQHIAQLEQQGLIIPGSIGFMGLSRGGFVALHVAALLQSKYPPIPLVGFAPVTNINLLKEFRQSPTHSDLSLDLLIPQLYKNPCKFYIGNHDTRVSTASAFSFLQQMVHHALSQKVRSPNIEMTMTPSIGRDGHGTSPQAFFSGASWIAKQLSL